MKKRLLIIVLCLCMLLLPFAPVHADQEDDSGTYTIELEQADGSGSITVQVEKHDGADTELIFDALPEPVIVYPITKIGDPALQKDEYVFCNAMFATSMSVIDESVAEYFERVDKMEIPYQSVSAAQDSTTIHFNDHFSINLIGDPVRECYFQIASNGKTLSVPVYNQWHTEEELFAYIMKASPEKELDIETIGNFLKSEYSLPSYTPQDTNDHIFLALLEATTAWNGMPYETFLQVKQDYFPYSKIRSDNGNIVWCSHDCYTNGLSIEYAFYFTDNTLSGIGFTLNPPDSFMYHPDIPNVMIQVATNYVDLGNTPLAGYIIE